MVSYLHMKREFRNSQLRMSRLSIPIFARGALKPINKIGLSVDLVQTSGAEAPPRSR
jgi:hypothetical protein